MFYIVILLLCADTVACGLIYSESVEIRTLIPQTANGNDIVRVPGNPSSVPPIFLLCFDPVGSLVLTYLSRCLINSTSFKKEKQITEYKMYVLIFSVTIV
jgi:hypothetical protein